MAKKISPAKLFRITQNEFSNDLRVEQDFSNGEGTGWARVCGPYDEAELKHAKYMLRLEIKGYKAALANWIPVEVK